MNPEFLKHIYESFEREHSTTESGVQGVGLGMSITKRLVDLLGGTIEIESELGVGTKTTLRFKAHVPERLKRTGRPTAPLITVSRYLTCATSAFSLSRTTNSTVRLRVNSWRSAA